MSASTKAPLTGTAHTLPFGELSPRDFERLCLWLVQREDYERAEHLGAAGSEQGRDVVAWKAGRRFVFQCKRVKAFTVADAKAEVAKLRTLETDQQPHELVFVVTLDLRADTRDAIRKAWGDDATCHFWCGTELDERVKRHADIVGEFFQLPPPRGPVGFLHNLPYPSLGMDFKGREDLLDELARDLEHNATTAIVQPQAIHGLGGTGKTRLAVEYALRSAERYTAAFFVHAESRAALRAGFARLADRDLLNLDLPGVAEDGDGEKTDDARLLALAAGLGVSLPLGHGARSEDVERPLALLHLAAEGFPLAETGSVEVAAADGDEPVEAAPPFGRHGQIATQEALRQRRRQFAGLEGVEDLLCGGVDSVRFLGTLETVRGDLRAGIP